MAGSGQTWDGTFRTFDGATKKVKDIDTKIEDIILNIETRLQGMTPITDSTYRNLLLRNNVNEVDNQAYVITDIDNYNEIWVNPSSADRIVTMPDPTASGNLYRKIKIKNVGAGTYKITLAPDAAETFNVLSGNEEWTLSSFELLQSGDWCEFIGNGTNWIKCNEAYWHLFNNPGVGNLATKVGGWTDDQFTPGGLQVTYSSAPIGSLAVRTIINQSSTLGVVFYRKSGDANISNTPGASSELSHRIIFLTDSMSQCSMWLSSDKKVELSVLNAATNTDLFCQYPIEYLQ